MCESILTCFQEGTKIQIFFWFFSIKLIATAHLDITQTFHSPNCAYAGLLPFILLQINQSNVLSTCCKETLWTFHAPIVVTVFAAFLCFGYMTIKEVTIKSSHIFPSRSCESSPVHTDFIKNVSIPGCSSITPVPTVDTTSLVS